MIKINLNVYSNNTNNQYLIDIKRECYDLYIVIQRNQFRKVENYSLGVLYIILKHTQ